MKHDLVVCIFFVVVAAADGGGDGGVVVVELALYTCALLSCSMQNSINVRTAFVRVGATIDMKSAFVHNRFSRSNLHRYF